MKCFVFLFFHYITKIASEGPKGVCLIQVSLYHKKVLSPAVALLKNSIMCIPMTFFQGKEVLWQH